MTQEERDKRKNTWDTLTDKQRREVERKKNEIIQQTIEKEEKAVEKLKEQGKWMGGLDGVYPELEEISSEHKRQLNELLYEYGIEPIY